MSEGITYEQLISNKETDLDKAKRMYKFHYIDHDLDHVCPFDYFFKHLKHLWKDS